MKSYIINFSRTQFEDPYQKTIYFPDDVKFCEIYKLSSTQKNYCIFEWYSDERYIIYCNSVGKDKVYRIGNIMICYIRSCYINDPNVDNFPKISIEEVNDIFKDELKKYMIVHTISNPEYEILSHQFYSLQIHSTKDNKIDLSPIQEAIDIEKKLKTLKKNYIGCIECPVKFSGSFDGPTLTCKTLYPDANIYKIEDFNIWHLNNSYFNVKVELKDQYEKFWNDNLLRILNYE